MTQRELVYFNYKVVNHSSYKILCTMKYFGLIKITQTLYRIVRILPMILYNIMWIFIFLGVGIIGKNKEIPKKKLIEKTPLKYNTIIMAVQYLPHYS